MSEWVHELPLVTMALLVFGFTYLVTIATYGGVFWLATPERTRSFKALSPGMLPPLGIIFGLFVAFIAAQVWADNDHAKAAVDREASSVRDVVLLAHAFPGEVETRVDGLMRNYVESVAKNEWPRMAERSLDLRLPPRPLLEALALVFSLQPRDPGAVAAQRDMANAVQSVLEARRQRILISYSEVNTLKWICLYLQAICALVAIAIVHCDNKLACRLAMGLFSTGIAASVLLIAAHDRPFVGQISVKPEALLQVLPDIAKTE